MTDSGVININKGEGMTSHDVVYKARKRLGIKKVGHTGTLDPMATGVLPVCFGCATRFIEYYDADLKTYKAEMELGYETDTLDATGEVTERADEGTFDDLTEEKIAAVFRNYEGTIEQVPPKYSALKVDGKRLYEYARKGMDIDIAKRKAYIERCDVDSVDLDARRIAFTVVCAKGTYIRSICRDIGRELGVFATMTSLVRMKSGPFGLDSAVTVEEMNEMSDDELSEHILKIDETLENLGSAEVGADDARRFSNGNRVDAKSVKVNSLPDPKNPSDAVKIKFERLFRMYGPSGTFLGTAEKREEDALEADGREVFCPAKVVPPSNNTAAPAPSGDQ